MQHLIPTFNAERKRTKRFTALLQPNKAPNLEIVDLPELDPEKKASNEGPNDAKRDVSPNGDKDRVQARAANGELPSSPMDTTINQGITAGQKVLGMIKESTAWDVYNNEAKMVDAELIKDWRDSLSTLLVFASIFAAVLTAVIIETKKLLEPDSTGVMLDVLITLTNNFANGTHNIYTQEPFVASPEAVTVNCLLFASLGVSLTAALTSVVALQWVADYDAAITRGGGSPRDEAIRRQLLFGGILSWGMKEVIAALPLLLYCAVVLFFAGAVEWISAINLKVGETLYGTAAIALGFYVITTFLAVVSVSAPFRTPLSRGIYRVIGSIIWLVTYLITRKDASHLDPRRRPDAAVNKDKTLVKQALLWVGRELSLNIHAHRRFILLVSEMCKLPKDQLASPEFQDAPWPAIFEIIGVKYLKGIQDDSFDEVKDGADIAWLATMASTPEIREIITPKEGKDDHRHPKAAGEDYCLDDQSKTYWEQYQINGLRLEGFNSIRPNSTFLLTRDAPIASPGSRPETKAMVEVIKWRNTGCKEPATPWLVLFADEKSYSNIFFNSLVDIFVRHTTSVYTNSSPKTPIAFEVFLHINRGSIRRHISRKTVISLLNTFEMALVASERESSSVDRVEGGFLRTPYSYAKALEGSGEAIQAIHDSFLILLVRGIGTLAESQTILDQPTQDEVSQNVKELLSMTWMRLRDGHVSRWASTAPGPDHSPDWIDKLWSSNSVLWTDALGSLPHAIEIIGTINRVRRLIPTLGQLWLFNAPKPVEDTLPGSRTGFLNEWRIEIRNVWIRKQHQQKPNLIGHVALQLELLLGAGRSAEDHLNITRFFYEDLRGYLLQFTSTLGGSTQVAEGIQSICDPCLCLLANWALDMPALSDILPTETYLLTYNNSWNIVTSYISGSFPNKSGTPRHFRASFLRFLPALYSKQFASGAFTDPLVLWDIMRIFNCPLDATTYLHHPVDSLTIKDHKNGIRMLLYLWRASKFTTETAYEEPSTPLVISLQGNEVNTLLFILLQSDGTEYWNISQLCVRNIREICKPIMEQQVPFLTLLAGLSHVGSPDVYHHRPEDLAIILELLRRALLLDTRNTPTILFVDLADRLHSLRQRLLEFMPGSSGRDNVGIAGSLESYVGLLRAKCGREPLWTNTQRRLLSCTLEPPLSSGYAIAIARDEKPVNHLSLNLAERDEYRREIFPLFTYQWFDGNAVNQAEAESQETTYLRYQSQWAQSATGERSETPLSPISASPIRPISPSSFIPMNIFAPPSVENAPRRLSPLPSPTGEHPPWMLPSLPSRSSSPEASAISSIFTPAARHALQPVLKSQSEFPTDTHLFYAISRSLGRGRNALPVDIIVRIFSYTGFCKGRPHSIALSDHSIVVSADGSTPSDALFFHSQPLTSGFLAKVGRIKLSTLGKDQGWVSDPTQGSWSWFEIRILTPIEGGSGSASTEDDIQLAINPFTPFSLQRYRSKREPPNESTGFKGAFVSHHNGLASKTMQHHIGEGFTPEGDLFGALEEGDILAVYACARFSGWINSAKEAELVVWERFDPTTLG